MRKTALSVGVVRLQRDGAAVARDGGIALALQLEHIAELPVRRDKVRVGGNRVTEALGRLIETVRLAQCAAEAGMPLGRAERAAARRKLATASSLCPSRESAIPRLRCAKSTLGSSAAARRSSPTALSCRPRLSSITPSRR